MRARHLANHAILTLLLGTAVLSGCAIDVDLASAPAVVEVGDTVGFDVSVRNRTTCPVGGVLAVLVPFVPRNLLISQIPDPDVREELSALVDAFCSGADVQPPDGSGSCRIENGELICELNPAMTLPGPLPEAAVATTETGEEVTCASDGTRLTCRFPHAVVQQAMAQAATSETSLGDLQCGAGANIAVCGALLLDPNETKSAQVQMTVPRSGILHNWIVSAATVRGGVCTGGLVRRRPCDGDGDCTGMGNTCGSGICSGGTRDGFGCYADGDCGGGTCVACEIPDDGQLLSGVACTTTASAINPAPAMTTWGLGAAGTLLGLIGLAALRRAPRRR